MIHLKFIHFTVYKFYLEKESNNIELWLMICMLKCFWVKYTYVCNFKMHEKNKMNIHSLEGWRAGQVDDKTNKVRYKLENICSVYMSVHCTIISAFLFVLNIS